MMKTVICSHGFGVRADDRKLFTDIAARIPEVTFVTFDYNTVDAAGNITVSPLDKQAKLLQEKLDQASGEVILLAHSQGCIVASMVDLSKVSKVIFLAPPPEISIERFLRKFGGRPGSHFDPAGESYMPRRDGTTTYIGKDYMQSISNIDVAANYKKISSDKLLAVCATADEVLGDTDLSYLPIVKQLPADHNFSGAARNDMIAILRDAIL